MCGYYQSVVKAVSQECMQPIHGARELSLNCVGSHMYTRCADPQSSPTSILFSWCADAGLSSQVLQPAQIQELVLERRHVRRLQVRGRDSDVGAATVSSPAL